MGEALWTSSVQVCDQPAMKTVYASIHHPQRVRHLDFWEARRREKRKTTSFGRGYWPSDWSGSPQPFN